MSNLLHAAKTVPGLGAAATSHPAFTKLDLDYISCNDLK